MTRLTALVLAASLLPATALAASGEVTYLEGKATRTPQGGGKVALALKSGLEQGDTIETSAGAKLEITLADKSVMRLGPSSKLKLDVTSFSENSREFKATLILGKVWSKVSSIFGSERTFEVRTERAVAGVRGTIFRVDAARSKAVLVKVYTGTVAVAGTGAVPAAAPPKGERVQIAGPQQVSRQQWEKIISAMMQVSVGPDGKPSEPKGFTEQDEAKDAWAAWNRGRDAALE
jgi:hypothetical protein